MYALWGTAPGQARPHSSTVKQSPLIVHVNMSPCVHLPFLASRRLYILYTPTLLIPPYFCGLLTRAPALRGKRVLGCDVNGLSRPLRCQCFGCFAGQAAIPPGACLMSSGSAVGR